MAIAFLTLLMGTGSRYFQLRNVSNKTSFIGLPKSLSDVIKLFSKEYIKIKSVSYFSFLICSFLGCIWLIFVNYFFVAMIYISVMLFYVRLDSMFIR